MARIGVFGLNLSVRSGGVYRFIDTLMQNAYYSRNEFTYVCPDCVSRQRFPDNVALFARPAPVCLANRFLLRLSAVGKLFASTPGSISLLSAITCTLPRLYRQVDIWLWPHCFWPVPRLGRTAVICHDMIHRHYRQYFSRSTLLRRSRAEQSLHLCELILCPSRSTAEDLLSVYPQLSIKTKVFPEAPCEIFLRRQCFKEVAELRQMQGDAILFLFVGVDWPHKNHEVLIKAALKLRSMTSRKFKIVFAGQRRGNVIAQMIKRHGAGDCVVDLGGVTSRRLAACYLTASVLVFPSLYEGFGIPLVEAMHYGLPIIAGNTSSVAEVCGGAAVLLEPTRPELWAGEMLKMIEDRNHRQRYSRLSGKRAARYTWKQTWQQIDGIFEDYFGGSDKSHSPGEALLRVGAAE